MAEISASLVKTLRDQTGAGMMDCKKALTETSGDLEAATEWLRKKGLSAASKKAGRVAAEGLVAALQDQGRGVLVEINAETDFVGRNELFQNYVKTSAHEILKTGHDIQTLEHRPSSVFERTFGEELQHLIAVIGENLAVRRSCLLEVSPGVVSSYIHNAVAPGLGRLGVLVALQGPESAALENLGRQIAMHIAALNPQALSVDELDPTLVARERAILMEQAQSSGRPAEVIEKMVEGRLRKFYQEVVLLEQAFVIDPQKTVAQALAAFGKEHGTPVTIQSYARFALGEGIEKQDADFAQEVAAQISSN